MMLSRAFTGVIRFFRSESPMIQCTYRQNKTKCNHFLCWRQSRKKNWYSLCDLDSKVFECEIYKILISHLILIISNLLAEKAIPKTVSPDYQNYYLKKKY